MVNLATAKVPAVLDEELQLPGSLELPDSDDTPVDNEGQNDIPRRRKRGFRMEGVLRA